MTRRPAGTVAAVAAGVLILAGCGVNTEEAGRSSKTSTTAAPTAATDGSGAGAPSGSGSGALSTRPDGTVALSSQENAFTDQLVGRFGAGSSDVMIASTRILEANAYRDLCSGLSDIVQTSILPTPADDRDCAARGLEIAKPVQLGSDAVVLATRNTSDVGGDCLTVRQARDVFRDGSPYTNWDELGFDDLELKTAGREDGSDTFEFFGLEALGLADPTLGDVRSDFAVRRTDAAERDLVTGVGAVAAANDRADRFAARQRRRTRDERKQAIDQAVAAADRKVNRGIAKVNKRNARRERIVDGEKLRRENARKASQAKSAARTKAARRFDRPLKGRVARFRDRAVADARRGGYIGHFSLAYYELFEAVLRPMEIDFGVPETTSGQPVRFGDLSEEDQQRVAPAVRAALPQQASGTGGSEPAPSNSAAGTTGSVEDIGENTVLPNIDGLPAKTASGQDIAAGPNCVFPSQATVTTGAYPLTRRIFFVTTKTGLARPEVRKLLTYALDNVQSQAGEARVVPITDQQRRDAYIAVTGSGTGGTGSTGSSAPESAPAQSRPARPPIPGVAGG